ncbi:hypothetical protein D9M68_952740 [compost metagenome]
MHQPQLDGRLVAAHLRQLGAADAVLGAEGAAQGVGDVVDGVAHRLRRGFLVGQGIPLRERIEGNEMRVAVP